MMKNTARKAAQKRSLGYLVATFEKFLGAEMALLAEEECQGRGIEPGKLTPFHRWSSEQQTALYELAEVIAELAVEDIIRSGAPGSHG